jgi:hypothetical protein
MDDILTIALASTTITKVFVDILRQARPIQGWVLPILSLIGGITASLLFLLSFDVDLTTALLSKAVLSGVLAAGGAIGVTELQNRGPK